MFTPHIPVRQASCPGNSAWAAKCELPTALEERGAGGRTAKQKENVWIRDFLQTLTTNSYHDAQNLPFGTLSSF